MNRYDQQICSPGVRLVFPWISRNINCSKDGSDPRIKELCLIDTRKTHVALTGIESMTSAMRLQCSTNCAMNPLSW